MKHLRLAFFAWTALSSAAWAQPALHHNEQSDIQREERLDRLRVAFFSEQLELSAEEAQAFWPIMQAHENAIEQNRMQLHELMETPPKTTSDAQEHVARMTELRKQEINLDSALLLDLIPLLGPERALKMPQLERRFRMRIMEAARGRGEGMKPNTGTGEYRRH